MNNKLNKLLDNLCHRLFNNHKLFQAESKSSNNPKTSWLIQPLLPTQLLDNNINKFNKFNKYLYNNNTFINKINKYENDY